MLGGAIQLFNDQWKHVIGCALADEDVQMAVIGQKVKGMVVGAIGGKIFVGSNLTFGKKAPASQSG